MKPWEVLRMSAAAAPITGGGWNPAAKSPNAILEDSDYKLASITPQTATARSKVGKSSGRWQVGISPTSNGLIGIATSTITLAAASRLGIDTGSNCAAWGNGAGQLWSNGSFIDSGDLINGAHVTVLLDLDTPTQQIYWFKNGVYIGTFIIPTGLTWYFAATCVGGSDPPLPTDERLQAFTTTGTLPYPVDTYGGNTYTPWES